MGAERARCIESVRRVVDTVSGEVVWSGYELTDALRERRAYRDREGREATIETVGVSPRGEGGRYAA